MNNYQNLNLKFTFDFTEALNFSEAKASEQTDISSAIEDQELSELIHALEFDGFTIRHAMETGKDIALHLERTGKRSCGVIVLRKAAISIRLLNAIRRFLENRKDTQVVVVNGCNSIGDEPDEEISDFWICMIAGDGIFYSEDQEPVRAFGIECF